MLAPRKIAKESSVESTNAVLPTSQVKYSEFVEQAAGEVFNSTCGIELAKSTSTEDACANAECVVAVISLVGSIEWSIYLGLPRGSAEKAAGKFAGCEIPFDSPDIGDAIGELANILAGIVKAKLDAKGVKAEISLPSVVKGQGLSLMFNKHSMVEKISFTSPLGEIYTGVVQGRIGQMAA